MAALAATPLVFAACGSLALPPASGDIQTRADLVATDLARIRDLPLEKTVPAGWRSKKEVRGKVLQELDKEWAERGAGIERAYKLLGLLPREIDLKSDLTALLEEQIAGYYDPEEKRFYAVDQTGRSGDDEKGGGTGGSRDLEFLLAHELTHAIEDRHFDLDALREQAATDEDRETALTALVEGSAMEAGIEYGLWLAGSPLSTAGLTLRTLIRNLISDDPLDAADDLADLAGDAGAEAEQLENAPPVLRAELILPYLQGWRFVNRLRSEFGWRAVDEAYRDLPESTEQILHPERYIDRRDRPVAITLPPAPSGCRVVHEGALGSFRLAILLRALDGSEDIASGWDGDRYVVWETETGDALGWVLVFDREGQAEDFAEAYERLADRQYQPGGFALKRRGDVVAAVVGAPDGRAGELTATLLESELERTEDDQPPDRWWGDVLRFPLSVRLLDRVVQTRILGGFALDLRTHDGGHRFRLLDSLLLHSENNPDRTALWLGLGLVGFDRDRTLDATYWRIVPGVMGYQGIGEGDKRRASFSMLLDAIEYRHVTGTRELSILWGLLFNARWGAGTSRGDRFRVLLLPIPGL